MPARTFSAVLSIILVALPLGARAAEFYLDAYGGVAVTEDSAVEVRVSGDRTRRSADYGAAVSAGFRGGLWWERVPWLGLAQDFSYFEAESDEAEVELYSFSTMVMFRVPLAPEADFPAGRIFPYLGLGPSLFHADIHADLRPAASRSVTEDTWDVGYQAAAGLQWKLNRQWSLFGEYRYTYRDVTANNSRGTLGGCFICFSDSSAKTTLRTHHLLFGVSFWF